MYTRVQSNVQLLAVSCIRRLCLPNTISQSIRFFDIFLMATSEHGDKAEIADPVPHSLGEPAPQASFSPVLDTADDATREQERLSTSQILGTFFCYHASMWSLILSSVNVSSPKKRGSPTRILNSERRLEIPRAIVDDNCQLQGAIGFPQSEGPSGRTYPTCQHSENPAPKSIPALIGRCSSSPGAPVKVTAVSIPAHDLPHEPFPNSNVPTHEYVTSHQSQPLSNIRESNSITNTALRVGTSEQPSRKRSLLGRD